MKSKYTIDDYIKENVGLYKPGEMIIISLAVPIMAYLLYKILKTQEFNLYSLILGLLSGSLILMIIYYPFKEEPITDEMRLRYIGDYENYINRNNKLEKAKRGEL